jgi:hypothetical protein
MISQPFISYIFIIFKKDSYESSFTRKTVFLIIGYYIAIITSIIFIFYGQSLILLSQATEFGWHHLIKMLCADQYWFDTFLKPIHCLYYSDIPYIRELHYEKH